MIWGGILVRLMHAFNCQMVIMLRMHSSSLNIQHVEPFNADKDIVTSYRTAPHPRTFYVASYIRGTGPSFCRLLVFSAFWFGGRRSLQAQNMKLMRFKKKKFLRSQHWNSQLRILGVFTLTSCHRRITLESQVYIYLLGEKLPLMECSQLLLSELLPSQAGHLPVHSVLERSVLLKEGDCVSLRISSPSNITLAIVQRHNSMTHRI